MQEFLFFHVSIIITRIHKLNYNENLTHTSLSNTDTISGFGLEDGARLIVECPKMKRTPRLESSNDNEKVSLKETKLVIKGNSIHLRLSHPNGKERVTVGTKNTLREFKTFLVSKLKLRCPWDTLKISQDKNVLSNPSNTKLLSDHVSSGGGWSSFGSHARNNGNVTLSTFELKPKTVLYVFYPAKAVMKKKNQKNAVCKICGDVENHRSKMTLFEGIGAIRKDYEMRRLIAIDLSYNDISLPRMEICEKCTWCSSAKRENFNHVTHLNTHYVVRST